MNLGRPVHFLSHHQFFFSYERIMSEMVDKSSGMVDKSSELNKSSELDMFYGNAARNCVKYGEIYIQRKDTLAFIRPKFVLDLDRYQDDVKYREYIFLMLPLFVYSKILSHKLTDQEFMYARRRFTEFYYEYTDNSKEEAIRKKK